MFDSWTLLPGLVFNLHLWSALCYLHVVLLLWWRELWYLIAVILEILLSFAVIFAVMLSVAVILTFCCYVEVSVQARRHGLWRFAPRRQKPWRPGLQRSHSRFTFLDTAKMPWSPAFCPVQRPTIFENKYQSNFWHYIAVTNKWQTRRKFLETHKWTVSNSWHTT